IDNLAVSSALSKPTPQQSTTESIPSSKLDDVWKELKDLRQLVTTAPSTKPTSSSSSTAATEVSAQIKAYVKREIKRHDKDVLESLIRPEIARELARMDVRFNQRLEKIKSSRGGEYHDLNRELPDAVSPIHQHDQKPSVHINESLRQHTLSPSPLHPEDESIISNNQQSSLFDASTNGHQEEQDSYSIHWEGNPDIPRYHSNNQQQKTSSNASSKTTAEQELHDLMHRLKRDLDKRIIPPTSSSKNYQQQQQQQHPSKSVASLPHYTQTGSTTPPSSASKRPTSRHLALLSKQHSYSQPTFSSRLKTRGGGAFGGTPAWK
ncbi:UNVERIFIED_CONTAM: hypothetical protein HDU68_006816, partial [Siphonaria sp. JEL0065]